MRVVRVLAPNPGVFTLEGTNTWIVGRGPAAVIDPGPDDPGHVRTVLEGAGPIGAVLVTHGHPDHAEGADRLARAAHAPVLAFRPREGQERLADGQAVDVGGARLVAVHTPGHSADHTAFFVEEVAALFTGDAVLGRGTSVIDPPEGDLSDYLRSLRRMRDLGPRTLYPGHGPAVFDGVRKLDEYLEHRAMREEQIVSALQDGLDTPERMVPAIYTDHAEELYPAAARSILAHLLKLEREGRVTRVAPSRGDRFALAEERACERCGRPAMPRSKLCRRCSLDLLQEEPER